MSLLAVAQVSALSPRRGVSEASRSIERPVDLGGIDLAAPLQSIDETIESLLLAPELVLIDSFGVPRLPGHYVSGILEGGNVALRRPSGADTRGHGDHRQSQNHRTCECLHDVSPCRCGG